MKMRNKLRRGRKECSLQRIASLKKTDDQGRHRLLWTLLLSTLRTLRTNCRKFSCTKAISKSSGNDLLSTSIQWRAKRKWTRSKKTKNLFRAFRHVMRVKGKVLNSFLGYIKSDLARLSIEAFPPHINKQIRSLILLPKINLVWFDIQVESRVATLRANFFTGVNTGGSIYRLGFLCLIGIAHLPEPL